MALPLIRLATPADLPAINEIYNHYVLHSTCTYQEEPSTIAERQAWFAGRGPTHPVTVAEEDGQVLGWASLSSFRARAAYRFTVENAVYVRQGFHGRGIGSGLLADCIEHGRSAGLRSIIAVIDAEQPASIALHRKYGFEQAARLREAGFKFGRWLDVLYMQKMLQGTPPAA